MDKAHYALDLDKIFFAAGLLKDRAGKWYETIHFLVNEDAATMAGKPFNPNSPWVTWSHFRKALSDSFGGSLTREKAVGEWDSLEQKSGHIDEYLDRISQLVWSTGYSGPIIMDKIKSGLTPEMRVEWSRVINPPKDVAGYMVALRNLGHQVEDAKAYERTRRGGGSSSKSSTAAPQKSQS